MSTTFRKYVFATLTLALSLTLLILPASLRAQDALTVSVTPPLFQLTIGPGEFWASSLKIVNSNEFDVTYYTSVVNFETNGEGGTGKFIPLIDEFGDAEKNTHSLASWIDITDEPILVPKGQSYNVPLTVTIPENAEPGGHSAAVLVGTQPPEDDTDTGPTVSVSSFVSSLFFVRVQGDVVERARIREFVTKDTLYEKPEAQFVLRFENTGTVHVQPQGNITIYNMWGKERGNVSINQNSNFGNVLPDSVRRFEFMWSGDFSPFDIGRYSAVVTLAYGEEVKQNVSATTYFWVIPIVPVASSFGALLVIILGITFLIRRYIKHVLSLERSLNTPAPASGGAPEEIEEEEEEPQLNIGSFTQPIREGIVDLRNIHLHKGTPEHEYEDYVLPGGMENQAPEGIESPTLQHSETDSQGGIYLGEFILKYRLFLIFVLLVVSATALATLYFGEAFVPSRTFEISNISSQEEEILKDVE